MSGVTAEPEVELELEAIKPRWLAWWDGARAGEPGQPSYRLTSFLILRLLGAVYVAAFVSLATQVVPLIGSRGLLPADLYLSRVEAHFGSALAGAWNVPSIFWLGISDGALVWFAWAGALLSLAVMFGYANAILMAVLWLLYSSFVHIGQLWYGYGWEIQLLETGFLAIFLCPLLDGRPFPVRPPPAPVIVLFRWLAFRIMIGAGLIKLRGDPCWLDLTCLYHHYETQPIPNPLSRLLHFMPLWFHRLGVAFNHFAELVAPLFAFGPRKLRHAAGVVMVLFQLILIASGNLSFLNWLTIVPMLACFDDGLLGRVLPRRLVALADRSARESLSLEPSRARRIATGAIVLLVSVLSIEPAVNLLSGEQLMNASFDPFDLVNTYGAFGSVGKTRDEIIFEGTSDETIGEDTVWRAYEFPCKPGDPERAPCWTGPYQCRLDWQIWFAAMSSAAEEPWTVHLVWKLLHGDAGALSLLANDPFPERPPRWIRAELYRYAFAPIGEGGGAWWTRERIGAWLPAVSKEDPRLLAFLREYGWLEDPAD